MEKNIALLQMNAHINDVAYNFTHAEELIHQAMANPLRPDILVLPETWNTGFAPSDEVRQFADVDGTQTQTLLSRLAKQYEVNIVGGSISTLEDEKMYNTTYVYNRDGDLIHTYHKIHAFSPAHENDFYSTGEDVHYFELDGIYCSSMICYDIRFPELARTMALHGIQLLFVPAQWPAKRLEHWQLLNKARAVENQMFLCAVNASGESAGHSLLLDPWGQELLHLSDQEEIQVGTIDTTVINDIRESINVFRDRKPSAYQLD